jgi:hypothetical protein
MLHTTFGTNEEAPSVGLGAPSAPSEHVPSRLDEDVQASEAPTSVLHATAAPRKPNNRNPYLGLLKARSVCRRHFVLAIHGIEGHLPNKTSLLAPCDVPIVSGMRYGPTKHAYEDISKLVADPLVIKRWVTHDHPPRPGAMLMLVSLADLCS